MAAAAGNEMNQPAPSATPTSTRSTTPQGGPPLRMAPLARLKNQIVKWKLLLTQSNFRVETVKIHSAGFVASINGALPVALNAPKVTRRSAIGRRSSELALISPTSSNLNYAESLCLWMQRLGDIEVLKLLEVGPVASVTLTSAKRPEMKSKRRRRRAVGNVTLVPVILCWLTLESAMRARWDYLGTHDRSSLERPYALHSRMQ